MSIDISNYYNYLNKISSSLTENIGSGQNSSLGVSDTDSTTGKDFQMAFLSMIQQSQPIYEKLAEVQQDDALSAVANDSAGELYNNLTNILDSYEKMKSESKIPTSIKESLFSMLDENKDNSGSDNMFPDSRSELNLDDIIAKASKNL